jgi:hypothetical protein
LDVTACSLCAHAFNLLYRKEKTMYQLSENDSDTRVHAKAKQRGQSTFTLVAQDYTAPATIAFWILQNIETAPPAKLREALEDALNMRDFPKRKRAD